MLSDLRVRLWYLREDFRRWLREKPVSWMLYCMPAHEDKNLPSLEECYRLMNEWEYIYPDPFEKQLTLSPVTDCDLSLIVPVYNSQDMIRRCVDSLINQKTKYNYQILLIDDGSTDNTAQILDKYAKTNTKIKVIHQENRGISGARNRGITESTGTYIGFVDNDDNVSEFYVEELLSRALTSEADVVKCGHLEVNKDGKVLREVKGNDISVKNGLGSDFTKVNGYIWGEVIRRSLATQFSFPLGYWFEDMITHPLIFRIAKSIECLPQPLYTKVNHGDNASAVIWRTNNPKSIDQVMLFKYCIDQLQRQHLPIDQNLLILGLHELGSMLNGRVKDSEHRKVAFRLSCEVIKEINDSIKPTPKLSIPQKNLLKSFLERDYLHWLKTISISPRIVR